MHWRLTASGIEQLFNVKAVREQIWDAARRSVVLRAAHIYRSPCSILIGLPLNLPLFLTTPAHRRRLVLRATYFLSFLLLWQTAVSCQFDIPNPLLHLSSSYG